MQKIKSILSSKELYLGLTRYFLGLMMITYAITKILRTQFVVLPFNIWQQPLESVSGRTIAWSFLGYSWWFQILLGILEFIPSVLLLFRRTTLLGAILLLPMTLNVFLINYALDLWKETQQISLVLVILNFIILILEWKKIRTVWEIILLKATKFRLSAVEVAINIVIVTLLLFFFVPMLLDYKKQTNVFTGDWFNGHPNEWTLISEKINDSTFKPHIKKSYFGSYGQYSEINDTGYVTDGWINYKLDESKHLLIFKNQKRKSEEKFSYNIKDSFLTLVALNDNTNNKNFTQTFKRRIIKSK